MSDSQQSANASTSPIIEQTNTSRNQQQDDGNFVPTLPKSVLGDQPNNAFLKNLPVQNASQLTTFEKKYHIVNEMGTGQYGTVYKVV